MDTIQIHYVKRDLRSIWWKCINRTFYFRLLDSTWYQRASFLVQIPGTDLYHFCQPILRGYTLFVCNLSIDSRKVQLEWWFNGQNNDKRKISLIIDWLFWIFFNIAFNFQDLPTLERAFFEIVVCVVVEECLFFYSHYALHKFRFLYVNIHKKHHEWQSTVAYAAIYAHPIGN